MTEVKSHISDKLDYLVWDLLETDIRINVLLTLRNNFDGILWHGIKNNIRTFLTNHIGLYNE